MPVGDHAGALVQPHNIEAEQALLGAILVQNEVLGQVEPIVSPGHFFDPVHARIFEMCQRVVHRKRALASPFTLKGYMADDPGLQELGGGAYLVALAGNVVSLGAAQEYARMVRELADRRTLIAIGDDVQRRAAAVDPDDPPDEQISAAEKSLYTLASTGQSSSGFQHFSGPMRGAIETAALAKKRGSDIAGLSTGLVTLDEKLGGLRKSDLLILAARPSMGKTALALNIAFAVARQRLRDQVQRPTAKKPQGGVVGFFSLEMSSEQLANRLLASEARIKSNELLTGRISDDQFHSFVDVTRDLAQLPLYIDETPALPISTLAARARRLKRSETGLDLLVVDYLQLVRAASGKDHGRVQEVSEITQGLKAIAKELDIPVLALSQLSRKVEEREDKRPQLSDLRESGSIEQDADVVMFIFRESYYHDRVKPSDDDEETLAKWKDKAHRIHNRAELIIGKQRHGPIGTAELAFEDAYTRFSDLAPDGYEPPPGPGMPVTADFA
ncbi:MAG: replicative DNA helicase [Pseudomonadota bacterium]